MDIAKGITMLTVIWMHVGNNIPKEWGVAWINGMISCLYMSCFFIISGFFIKDEPFGTFVKKKSKTLLLPLGFVYVISYIFALGCSKTMPTLLKNEVSFWNIFVSHNFTNCPIWFLSALFVALCVVFWIKKIRHLYLQIVAVLIISAIGYHWNTIFEFRLPLFADTGLSAVMFLYLGSYLKRLIDLITNRWLMFLLAMLILFGIRYWGIGCSMQDNDYYAIMPFFYLSSVAGSLAVIFLSKVIKNNVLLQYIGKNSLVILCFHMFVVMGTAFVIKKLPMEGLVAYMICFVVSSCISVAIVPVIKRTLKFIF